MSRKRTARQSDMTSEVRNLRIAAFNVQVYGEKKGKQKDITDILIKILKRYDLILIQEVRDQSQTVIDNLLEKINSIETGNPFDYEESERLGRTDSKEQYVFFYRKKLLSVTDTFQFDDGVDDGTDVFQREPFAVRFTSPTTNLQDFALIAIHTDPGDVVRELGALHGVYEVVSAHWGLENILICGDFNADGRFLSKKGMAGLKLKTQSRFKWLIDENMDTTVGKSHLTYDRFVAAGSELIDAVVPGSVKVFHFDRVLKLTKEKIPNTHPPEKEELRMHFLNWPEIPSTKEVSDHFPIELEILKKSTVKKDVPLKRRRVADKKQVTSPGKRKKQK